jgi:hypothetical protein
MDSPLDSGVLAGLLAWGMRVLVPLVFVFEKMGCGTPKVSKGRPESPLVVPAGTKSSDESQMQQKEFRSLRERPNTAS